MNRLQFVARQRIHRSAAPSEGTPDEGTGQCAEQEHDQQETDDRIAHCAQKVGLDELCCVNTVCDCVAHHARACCHTTAMPGQEFWAVGERCSECRLGC